MRLYKFKIPLYFGWLQIAVTEDFKDAEKRLGLNCEVSVDLYDAYSVRSDTAYVIVIKPNMKPSIIAHEALHIVNMLFQDRGIKLCTDNDEPSAYMLSWVVEKVYSALEKTSR